MMARIIRFRIVSQNRLRTLKETNQKVVGLSGSYGSDYPTFSVSPRMAEMAKDLKRKESEVCRII